MLLTLWYIFAAIVSLFYFGLPVAIFLADDDLNRKTVWITAPFIGLSVIILVLQNLIYLDVWITRSALWVWIGGSLLWLWMLRTGRLATIFSAMPRLLILAALAVYLLQGVGLLVVTARYYVGRAWIDQFNYTAYAQFLTNYPFSLTYDGIPNQPVLIKAISIKFDRIGVSVFQGFLASSTLSDPKTIFEPAVLLCPLLITLAVYPLARRLGLATQQSAFSAVGAGVLPAITMVHVETFFSQALGIPFLLLWPLCIADLIERPGWKRLLSASIILAGATTIYTEFYIIFLGTAALGFGFSALRNRVSLIRSILTFLLLVGIALCLNIGFLRSIYEIIGRVSWSNILANIYPWALTIEGIGRLWLGDVALVLQPTRWLWILYGGFSIGLVLLAYIGLGRVFWKHRDGLALSALALAAIPLVLRLEGETYPYQFYKLLLSISPLLLIGIVASIDQIQSAYPESRFLGKLVRAGKIALVLLFCVGTIGTTYIAGIFPFGGRSILAGRLLNPGATQVQDMLSGVKGQNILIDSSDNYMNAWLAYFARNNRVWVSNPFFSDINIDGIQQFKDLPGDMLLLTDSADNGLYDRSAQPVWSAGSYQLWRVPGNSWTVLLDVLNANGIEDWGGERGFWLGEGSTQIDMVSSKSGRATITADVTRGPSLPDVPDRHLMLSVGSAFTETITILSDSLQTFSVPVIAGPNRIILRALDRATVKELPNGDERALILGVRGLHVRLE